MPYNIDMLKFRKNTVKKPLQVCFCAATTRNFIGTDTHMVTKQEVEDVDIATACDAIIDGLSAFENQPRMSLHMSSQLMYGALRLFKEQVSSAEESAENLFSSVITSCDAEAESGVAKKTKRLNKKNTKTNERPSDSVLPEPVSDIDIVNILSKDLHGDLHLMDEINNYQLPPQPDEFPLGVLSDDAEDIDMVTNELCRATMREELHPRHSISVLNVQQDKEAQEDITIPLPFENENQTAAQKKHPQNVSNANVQDILRTQKPPRPLYGLRQRETSSSSETATTAYSPSRRIKNTCALADEPLATSTPSRYITSTGEDAPLFQPIEMPGSQTDMQPHAVNVVTAPQMMDIGSDELNKVDLPYKPMEVDESDVNGIHVTQLVTNKLITKSSKKIVVDQRINLKWIKEPRPQIFTKSLDIVISESVNSLLKLPATFKRKMFHNDGRPWAYCLIKMFDQNTQKPYRNFVEMDNLSNNRDVVREESFQPVIANKVQLSSSKIILKDLKVVLQRVKVSHESNVTAEDNVLRLKRPGHFEDTNIDTPFDESVDVIRSDVIQPVPTYSDNDNEAVGPDDNVSILAPTVKKFKPSHQCTMEILNQEVNLNVFIPQSKFFDSIQIYWKQIEEGGSKNKDREVNVTFDKLLNPNNVHVDQVIQYLYYCFDLEKSRKLYLKQETAYGTLYIIKPQ